MINIIVNMTLISEIVRVHNSGTHSYYNLINSIKYALKR